MNEITPVELSRFSLTIARDLSMSLSERTPGTQERVDGMTVGVITMDRDAAHGGEVHPDGDEFLYVISGLLEINGESDPEHPVRLGPGQACIVRKGEWHKVHVVEPAQLVHITPGPGGGHRPAP